MKQSERTKKILFVLPSLTIGGVSSLILDLCSFIDLTKYSIEIVLLERSTSILNNKSLDKDIKLHFLDYTPLKHYSILGHLKFIFFSREAKINKRIFNDLVKGINPDLIHFHTNPTELYLTRGLKKSIKLLYTDHSVRLQKNIYSKKAEFCLKNIYRFLYRGYNTISVSDTVYKTNVKYRFQDISKNHYLISNGIDVDYFTPELNSEKKHVVYITRLTDGKGIEELIRAWQLLKNKETKFLLIIGPDETNGRFRKMIEDLKLNGLIKLTGPQSSIKSYLSESLFAVFPSHKEGLPLSLLEKMSMELPVIVADIPELTSIVKNNENGLVFKGKDEVSLAEKIDYLYNNPMERNKLGLEARKTVISKYSKKQMLEETVMVYADLIR